MVPDVSFAGRLTLLERGSKHMQGSEERYLLGQNKTGKFRGNPLCNPLCQAIKRHLNNS